VPFERTAKPPQGETEPEDVAPSARVNKPIPQTRTATPIHTATIDKPIANTLTPRVQKPPASTDNNPARMEMRDRIRKYLQAKTMARITQRNMYLHQTTQKLQKSPTHTQHGNENVPELPPTPTASEIQRLVGQVCS
jgi:hypothetical protein